ncbi:hypothetical protein [uncultured Abyssibacter sp.]|uniref:hypothetical protein n=1 Tax=uncultured Abyssibacter sp. TaxID=2320202 RepID=UPI0032B1AAA5
MVHQTPTSSTIERRKHIGAPEFVEITQVVILQAADTLGTLTGTGATPRDLVDQVRASLVVRESDFARAIGMLVASDWLDILIDDGRWTYALTEAGRAHVKAWLESIDAESREWSTTHARARLQAIRALLATRARGPSAAERLTHH